MAAGPGPRCSTRRLKPTPAPLTSCRRPRCAARSPRRAPTPLSSRAPAHLGREPAHRRGHRRPALSVGETQDPRLLFYNTGPIYEKLAQQGIDPTPVMRDWSGQVAATSPRTQTPTNLRNASYLLYRQGTGSPFTQAEFEAAGNPPGYAFMGSSQVGERFAGRHAEHQLRAQTVDFPPQRAGQSRRPYHRHSQHPGLDLPVRSAPPRRASPRLVHVAGAYTAYRANGGFTPNAPIAAGAIDDSLANVTRGGVKKQIEYGPMTDPVVWRSQPAWHLARAGAGRGMVQLRQCHRAPVARAQLDAVAQRSALRHRAHHWRSAGARARLVGAQADPAHPERAPGWAATDANRVGRDAPSSPGQARQGQS